MAGRWLRFTLLSPRTCFGRKHNTLPLKQECLLWVESGPSFTDGKLTLAVYDCRQPLKLDHLMRRLVQQPKSVAAECIWTAVTVWKLLALPVAAFAVASAIYADNKFHPFLLFGGFYVASGPLGAGLCWLKSLPSWVIYWVRRRGT